MYTTFLYCIVFGLFYQQTESSGFVPPKQCEAGVTFSATGWESFASLDGGATLSIIPCTTCSLCENGSTMGTACTITSDTQCVFAYTSNLNLRQGQIRLIVFETSGSVPNPCEACKTSSGLGDLAGCWNSASFPSELINGISDYQPSDQQQQCLASASNTGVGIKLGPWDGGNAILGDVYTDDDCDASASLDTKIEYNASGTCLGPTVGIYFAENSGTGAYLCHYILLYNTNANCNPAPANWDYSLTQVRSEQCANSWNRATGFRSSKFELINNIDLDERMQKIYDDVDCKGTLEEDLKVYLGADNCNLNTYWPWTVYYSQYGVDCTSFSPTQVPTINPTVVPTYLPSTGPSTMPSNNPTVDPTVNPSVMPSTSPSNDPSTTPSRTPSVNPSTKPSTKPSVIPSTSPSTLPSRTPSTPPSTNPSVEPSTGPSSTPSVNPSTQPSTTPSVDPTTGPSSTPSVNPSTQPSTKPSVTPSVTPSTGPSTQPSNSPSTMPSANPTSCPSVGPTTVPSTTPSVGPSVGPTTFPSGTPSVLPSNSPSTDPSVAPSNKPSVVPTNSPSCVPSTTPSCAPSTAPTKIPTSGSCSESDPWTIGSELIRVNDAVSVFDDTNETLTVRIEWPLKYTLNTLEFLDANGDLDYTNDTTNGWIAADDATDDCISTLTKTVDWADAAAGGVSLMLNNDDDPPTYTFFIRVNASEEFVKTDSLGVQRDETRILLLDLPLKLELQDEIELTANFSVVIDEAALFDIIEYVAIASTNILEKASVNITFKTIMNYPWRLDEDSFWINDTSDVIHEESTAELIMTSEDCDDVGYGAECMQSWQILFTSTDMCGAQGWIDINMNATYHNYQEWLPVEMLLSLGKGTYFDCANVLGTVGLEGEIHVHDAANKYSTAVDTTSFYLEDLAYFTATFISVGPIEDISITNVDIIQDGQTACTNCTSDFEFELTVENEGFIDAGQTSNFINFYMNLAGQYLIGSTTGGVNTKIMITFEVDFAETPAGSGTRRRLLTITVEGSTEADLNTEQIELASTINILTSSCGPGIRKGNIKKTACSEKNVHIQICEAEGWKTLVNQCENSGSSASVVVEAFSEAETSTPIISNYLLASIALLGIIFVAGVYKYLQSTKKTKYSFQSEKQLNSVIIEDTKDSQI